MEKPAYNFKDSLAVGKEGEQAVLSYLKRRPKVKSVSDMRNNKQMQLDDIDFIVENKAGDKYAVEVKTDLKSGTGNIFAETISNTETGRKGCMEATKADYIIYFFILEEVAYSIEMKRFRKWFRENRHLFRYFNQVRNHDEKRGTYFSAGYLIPRATLVDEGRGWVNILHIPRYPPQRCSAERN